MSNPIDWGKVVTTILISAILGAGGAYLAIKVDQLELGTEQTNLGNAQKELEKRVAFLEKEPAPEVYGVMFGNYQKMDENFVHKASSDGIVIARIEVPTNEGNRVAHLFGHTHRNYNLVENRDKATLRTSTTLHYTSSSNVESQSIIMPVRSGDHWSVIHQTFQNQTQSEVLWIPLLAQDLSN